MRDFSQFKGGVLSIMTSVTVGLSCIQCRASSRQCRRTKQKRFLYSTEVQYRKIRSVQCRIYTGVPVPSWRHAAV